MADEDNTPVAEDGDIDTTSSSDTRWKYTATLLASILIVSIAVAIIGGGFGVISLSGIPQEWLALYAVTTLMAATWAFGKETLEAVNEARGK